MTDVKNITDVAEYLKEHARLIELHSQDIASQWVKALTDTEKRLIEHNRGVELPRLLNGTFGTILYEEYLVQDTAGQSRLERKREQECRTQEKHQQIEDMKRFLYKEKTRLGREQKVQIEPFQCRRCSATFPSNTKLHHHIQTKHTKKPAVQTSPPHSTLEESKTMVAALPPQLSFSPITCIEIQPSNPAKPEKSTTSSQRPWKRNLGVQ